MDLRRAARRAGIVHRGVGGPRPLEALLEAATTRPPRVVIASAADGEPLVATSRRAAAAYPAAVWEGLVAVVRATGAAGGWVAVERRAEDAREALAAARPGAMSAPLGVALVPDVARAGDASDLALDVAGVAVPPGDDPLAHGVLVLDAVALVDLAAAVAGRPVCDRPVTIAGAVARPGVRRLPIGTSVADAVAAAGGPTCGPAWVALADGPLAGRPLDADDVVTKGTRALWIGSPGAELVRRARRPAADSLRRALSACAHCAACSDACPPRLLGGRLRPDHLLRALGGAGALGEHLTAAAECRACGLCDVVCPAGLSPRELVAAAARALADRGITPATPAAEPVPGRDARRLSLSLVALRLGLGEQPVDPPWDPTPVVPARVELPLTQAAGGATRPVVRVGDRVVRGHLVAVVDDGAPGAQLHASIAGIVEEVDGRALVIRGAAPAPGA